MAVIVFDMIQAKGHYNASFKLAKMLNRRHRIIYTISENYRECVESQGLECCNIYQTDELSIQRKATNEHPLKRNSRIYRKIFSSYLHKLLEKFLESKFCLHRVQAVLKLQPAIVLVDSMVPLYRLILYQFHGIEIFILQTKVLPTKADLVPPACNRLIPNNSLLSKLSVHYLWNRYFVERFFGNFWRKLIFLGKDDYSVGTRVAKQCRFSLHDIESKRTFNYGFKSIPEIILSPRAFDFPRLIENNKIYAGFGVDLKRADDLNEVHYSELKSILSSNKLPLVYCSLGTLSMLHYKESHLFLKKVVEAFQEQPATLIMATGTEIDIHQFYPMPLNVHAFQTVPQLEVLKHADVMITHGGMNSIKECILNEVPMVVYPLNNKWDQPGNSARVVYHGLGLRGNVRSESHKKIIQKVMHLLTNDSYKQNLKTMKQKVIKEDKHIEVADMIDAIINQSRLLKQSA